MKRMISIVLTLVICLTLAAPVMATDFTPSVTYKPLPEFTGELADDGCLVIGFVEENGQQIGEIHYDDGRIYIFDGIDHEELDEEHACIVITAIGDAETSTEIPAESKEMLLWVYEQILKLGMSFFADCEGLNEAIAAALGEGKTVEDMVVRDLFDVSVICEPLETWLEPDGTTICLDFDLGLKPGTFLAVVAYKNGQWKMIEDVEINADGSVTCTTYENFCPVAFLVAEDDAVPASTDAPDTGVSFDNSLYVWGGIAVAALAALVVLIAVQRKRKTGSN